MEPSDQPRKARRNRAAHGTRVRYNRGCSCVDCTAANRDYQRARKIGITLAEYRNWIATGARKGDRR